MLISLYRRFKARRKARSLIKDTKSVLSTRSGVIDPEISEKARKKIEKLERVLNLDDTRDLEKEYSDLKTFSDNNLSGYRKSKLRQNIESILIALGLALLIRTFVIQPFKIPSGSMIPTLLIGDHLLVNKFVYGTNIPFTDIVLFPVDNIDRGDVIVFKFPEESERGPRKGVHYIKRVIAVEGDSVDIRGNDIYINNQKVEKNYMGTYSYEDNGINITADMYRQFLTDHDFKILYKKGSTTTTKGRLSFPLKVPEDTVFVMGDNRDNSYDSRFWGFVPVENISGKAFIIHWSWDFEHADISNFIRWERIFKSIS